MLLSKLFAFTSLCKKRPSFPVDFVLGLNPWSTMTHWWSTLLFLIPTVPTYVAFLTAIPTSDWSVCLCIACAIHSMEPIIKLEPLTSRMVNFH